jgi:hypothetical protein
LKTTLVYKYRLSLLWNLLSSTTSHNLTTTKPNNLPSYLTKQPDQQPNNLITTKQTSSTTKMHLPTLTLLTTLTLTLSSPINPPIFRRDSPDAATIIKTIMPKSATCPSSTDKFASDCRTADQAAPFLIAAMQKYDLLSSAQIAAVLALVAVESAELRYKHNVYPGRAGQGTSAMLMPDNVAKYAASIPELKDGVAAAAGDVGKVLELVVDDQYNFGAAQWWLTTQCTGDVVEGLKGASDKAWEAYMACVGVDASDQERLAYWKKAKSAFGLA